MQSRWDGIPGAGIEATCLAQHDLILSSQWHLLAHDSVSFIPPASALACQPCQASSLERPAAVCWLPADLESHLCSCSPMISRQNASYGHALSIGMTWYLKPLKGEVAQKHEMQCIMSPYAFAFKGKECNVCTNSWKENFFLFFFKENLSGAF